MLHKAVLELQSFCVLQFVINLSVAHKIVNNIVILCLRQLTVLNNL
jgi:hypothetical protein